MLYFYVFSVYFTLHAAVILRGVFVVLGAAALQRFHQILLFFAVILGVASYGILFPSPEVDEEDLSENAVIKFAKNFIRTTDTFDKDK